MLVRQMVQFFPDFRRGYEMTEYDTNVAKQYSMVISILTHLETIGAKTDLKRIEVQGSHGSSVFVLGEHEGVLLASDQLGGVVHGDDASVQPSHDHAFRSEEVKSKYLSLNAEQTFFLSYQPNFLIQRTCASPPTTTDGVARIFP